MKKKIIIVLILLALYPNLQIAYGTNDKKPKIIVLDAGHGGKDSGAIGLLSKEKDIVLSITLKTGEYILKNMPNTKVIYTRNTDVFIPLIERADIANKNNADLFVSIHANSNTNTKAFGTDTYVMGLHKTKSNLEVAQKENSVIVFEEGYQTTYQGFDPNSSESYIIFSLMQNTYLEQSLKVASSVQEQFREQAKRKDRGVKQAGFLVLWTTTMPSILVETGFISNPDEEKYLMSDQGQDYIASSIFRAIKDYLISLPDIDNDIDIYTQNTANTDSATLKNIDTKNKNNNIYFRVQVTSSSKSLGISNPIFKPYNNVFEYCENGMFKYTVGNCETIDDAKKLQEQLKADFPGAFLVAFKNNAKIPIHEALNSKN